MVRLGPGFAAPFSSVRTLTVGLGVAPSLLTPSDKTPKGARGLQPFRAITAGGDFHPAPRTRPTDCGEAGGL